MILFLPLLLGLILLLFPLVSDRNIHSPIAHAVFQKEVLKVKATSDGTWNRRLILLTVNFSQTIVEWPNDILYLFLFHGTVLVRAEEADKEARQSLPYPNPDEIFLVGHIWIKH